ncbi:hypothetical protein ACFSC4_26395 [Deinococcus malanensis]|uniref:hypothetical protein n=1 Tax=Deinococcus malanensis TaxID=1706855 RepID=UPI00362E4D75
MIAGHNRLHLSYCTNIHPSSGLAAVRDNLERYTVPVKARLSPEAPFGVGLRLSAAEAQELMVPGALEAFRIFLDQRGLYVFTMNGFPYGAFHGQPVKAQVHAPDWRSEERVQYTLHLARILAGLLPSGVNGGISTSPLSYRGWVAPDDEGAWEVMTSNIVRVVEALARMHEQQGVLIHLDVEPEPDGLLECTGDLVGFFRNDCCRGRKRTRAAARRECRSRKSADGHSRAGVFRHLPRRRDVREPCRGPAQVRGRRDAHREGAGQLRAAC